MRCHTARLPSSSRAQELMASRTRPGVPGDAAVVIT